MGTEQVMELTARERAIAAGEDPDAVGIAPAVKEDVVRGTEDGGGEKAEPGQDVDAASSDGGGTEAAGAGWVTDEIRQRVESYGLSADDLGAFGSADQFGKFAELVDRHISKPATPAEPKPAQTADSQPQAPLGLDPQKYVEAGYDEDTVRLVRFALGLQDKLGVLESEFSGFRKTEQEKERQVAESQFMDAFHAIASSRNKNLYGADGDVSREHDDNRRQVYDAMVTLWAGMESRGLKPPAMSVLFERGEQLALGRKLREVEDKERAKAIAAQSARRRPAAGSRAAAPGGSGRDDGDPIKAIANSPALVKMWTQFQEENGVL